MENRKIKEIEIFNVWGNNREVKITFDKDITYLTGYNGSGKSTILDIINTSSIDGKTPDLEYGNWCSKITLGLDVKFFFLGIDKEENFNIKSTHDTLQKRMRSNNISAKDIYHILEGARVKKSKIDDVKTKNKILKEIDASKISIKQERKNNNIEYDFFRFGQIHVHSEFKDHDIGDIIKPVFYRDEVFIIPNKKYNNISNNQQENLFDRDAKLNITLSELLIDFLAIEKKISDKSNQERIRLIENLIGNIDTVSGNKTINEEDIKKIQSILSKEKTSTLLDKRISFFEKEVNSYFECTNKKISRDERGIIEFKNNDKKISWINLSKGEKQILVLLLLAFTYSEDVMVFILDEPDLSLHVEWQKRIIKSMKMLSKKSQFIIATHSPILFMNEVDFDVINTEDLFHEF